ncbi:uncharacterized protein LOC132620171 [Lycium barbarum]|nr:uncharacterized protein LOC132620171 [Lycium barbarum]
MLSDAAQFFFGCDVKEYVRSTSVKKEDSGYYRKLLLSKGKEFSVLVKIDRNFATGDSKMNLIAAEIHEVEKLIAAYESEVETLIKKQRSKRTNKVKDNNGEPQQMTDTMKPLAGDIPYDETKNVADEIEIETPTIKLRSKRTRKVKMPLQSTR